MKQIEMQHIASTDISIPGSTPALVERKSSILAGF
jgi:hypothetical protein